MSMTERWNRQAWGKRPGKHPEPSERVRELACIACSGPAANFHHVLPQQWIKREVKNGKTRCLRDRRNLVPMCFKCHLDHENWAQRLTRDQIPEEAWEFARELGEPAVCALERYYPEAS